MSRKSLLLIVVLAVVCGVWFYAVLPPRPARREVPPPPDDAATAELLDQTAEFDFDETRLDEVLASLSAQFGIKMDVDWGALEDAGIARDAPLRIRFPNASLRAALGQIQHELDLVYFVEHDRIYWTTHDVYWTTIDAQRSLKQHLVVYPLPPPSFGSRLFGPQDTADLITTSIAPESWEEIGGPNVVRVVPGGLAIACDQHTHRMIRQCLDRWQQPLDDSLAPVPVLPISTPACREIRGALQQPVTLSYDQTPVEQFVRDLAEQLALPITIDRRSFDDVGLDGNLPITCKVKDVPLGIALQRTLRASDLTYLVRNDVLWITTPEEAEYDVAVTAFPVGDLIASPHQITSQELERLLVTTIAPFTWEDVGGYGAVQRYSNDLLVISNSDANLHQVSELFRQLRRVLADEPLGEDESSRRLHELLQQPAPDWGPLRIHDLRARIEAELGIPTSPDESLDPFGPKVQLEAGRPLREALDNALRPRSTMTTVYQGRLHISEEFAEGTSATHVIDVRDLVDPDFGAFSSSSLNKLVGEFYPAHWKNDPAKQVVGGILVVRQPQWLADELKEYIEFLRREQHSLPQPIQLAGNKAELDRLRIEAGTASKWRQLYLLHCLTPEGQPRDLNWLVELFVATARESDARGALLFDRLADISSIDDPELAVRELEPLAKSEHPLARQMAIELLGQIGKPAVPVLTRLLDRSESEGHVAGALGGIGPAATSALPALRQLVLEHDHRVALHAITRIDDPPTDFSDRLFAELLLAGRGSSLVRYNFKASGPNARIVMPSDFIQRLQQSDDPELREMAKQLIVRFGSKPKVKPATDAPAETEDLANPFGPAPSLDD